MRSRSFLDAVYETELPGMPDGKYVVIRYQASFENKADAVETIYTHAGQGRALARVRLLRSIGDALGLGLGSVGAPAVARRLRNAKGESAASETLDELLEV